jgi:hypothetical protein
MGWGAAGRRRRQLGRGACAQAAACTYHIAFGPRAGHKVLAVQAAMPRDTDFKKTLCAYIDGLSLHAAVRCDADDR